MGTWNLDWKNTKGNKMSMKYEYLEELKNDFIKALQAETQKATNEDDMDELSSIAEDLVSGIPVELMMKDYWTRSAIKNYVMKVDAPDKMGDTQYITRYMRYIYSEDAVYFGDYVNENLIETYKEFEEHENKGE